DGLTDADEIGKYGTDPNNPDTDGDGLNDGDEVLKYKTDPRKADTDGDNLTDGEEVLKTKTDPLKADTDGGGVPDGIEVKVANTNPLDPKDDVKKVKSIDLQILFDTNSDVVKPEYLPKVEEVAKFMKEYPQVIGTIEGHTDNRGDDAYNLDLSKRRAASVAKLLVERYGVEPARLKSEGYGETKPVASNDTAEGRQKNRRIMAIFEAK
ncbi:MAG TPA: OmpA family protein, partial [Candidatus Deferrimicrobiaceae bacterium]